MSEEPTLHVEEEPGRDTEGHRFVPTDERLAVGDLARTSDADTGADDDTDADADTEGHRRR